MSDSVRVLLVEDEVITAMFVEIELEKIGCQVTEFVTTGADALTSLRNSTPDVILMDIRLAGPLDGIETAQKIRDLYPSIPIVFCTSYEDNDIRARADRVHPLGFLSKPLSLSIFRKLLGMRFPGLRAEL